MKSKSVKVCAGLLITAVCTMVSPVMTVCAEKVIGEWREEGGNDYWYENGVKQGMEGRGKEIYDPISNI